MLRSADRGEAELEELVEAGRGFAGLWPGHLALDLADRRCNLRCIDGAAGADAVAAPGQPGLDAETLVRRPGPLPHRTADRHRDIGAAAAPACEPLVTCIKAPAPVRLRAVAAGQRHHRHGAGAEDRPAGIARQRGAV